MKNQHSSKEKREEKGGRFWGEKEIEFSKSQPITELPPELKQKREDTKKK